MVADELGVSPETVRVLQGDTDTAVFGMGTFASRTAVIAGGALHLAATDVRTKLLEIAGALMEIAVDDLEFANGSATARGRAGPIAHARGDRSRRALPALRIPGVVEPAPTALRTYDPPETYGNGTIVAVVEVDVVKPDSPACFAWSPSRTAERSSIRRS